MDDISESCPNLEFFELYSEHLTFLENIFIENIEALDEVVTNRFQKLSSLAIAFKRGDSAGDFGAQGWGLMQYLLAKCKHPDIGYISLSQNTFVDGFVYKSKYNRSFEERYISDDESSDEYSEDGESTKDDLNDDSNDEWTSYNSESDSESAESSPDVE